MDRIITSKDVLHIEDLLKDPDSVGNPAAKYGGARTFLGVPMLKDNEVVGAIIIFRQEVQPFSKSQIELVQNLANQAVIAIENTRLLNELRQRTDDLSRVARAANGDLGGVGGHLKLAWRIAANLQHDAGQGKRAVRSELRPDVA